MIIIAYRQAPQGPHGQRNPSYQGTPLAKKAIIKVQSAQLKEQFELS